MEEKHPGLPPEINAEDPIAQALTNFFNFCVRNAAKLALAGVCILLVIAGATGFLTWKSKQETNAATSLGVLVLDTGRSGDDTNLLSGLEKIGEENASTRAGEIALLYAARISAEKNDPAAALENYNKAFESLGKDPYMKKMILWERAYIFLALGNTKAALADFSELSSEKSAFQESSLYHVFRLEAAAGNTEKSNAARASLFELYPDSFYKLLDV